MFSRFEKVLIAIMLALLFAGVTLVAVSAQDETPPVVTQQETGECAKCHEDSQMSWQNGAHGNATIDPIFVTEWTNQGKPGACLNCHVTGYDEAAGEVYLYPSLAKLLVRDFLNAERPSEEKINLDGLTDREREVLTHLAEGASNDEIAANLFISPKTVERHRENIMRKLNLHSRSELVRYAIRKGIIKA
jgi:DNA-binding CsgD family transcriptional regulator